LIVIWHNYKIIFTEHLSMFSPRIANLAYSGTESCRGALYWRADSSQAKDLFYLLRRRNHIDGLWSPLAVDYDLAQLDLNSASLSAGSYDFSLIASDGTRSSQIELNDILIAPGRPSIASEIDLLEDLLIIKGGASNDAGSDLSEDIAWSVNKFSSIPAGSRRELTLTEQGSYRIVGSLADSSEWPVSTISYVDHGQADAQDLLLTLLPRSFSYLPCATNDSLEFRLTLHKTGPETGAYSSGSLCISGSNGDGVCLPPSSEQVSDLSDKQVIKVSIPADVLGRSIGQGLREVTISLLDNSGRLYMNKASFDILIADNSGTGCAQSPCKQLRLEAQRLASGANIKDEQELGSMLRFMVPREIEVIAGQPEASADWARLDFGDGSSDGMTSCSYKAGACSENAANRCYVLETCSNGLTANDFARASYFALNLEPINQPAGDVSISLAIDEVCACLDEPPISHAVCGINQVVLGNNAYVASQDEATNKGHVASGQDLTIGNNSIVHGSLVAGNNVTLKNNSRVFGDAFVYGQTDISNNAEISGDIRKLAEKPKPCGCGYDLDLKLKLARFENDNEQLYADAAISPYLIDGALVIGNNHWVTLPAGDYYLTRIEIKNNATLAIEAGAKVRLFVAGEITMKNNSAINSPKAENSHVMIISGAQASQGQVMQVKNNSESWLDLYAPLAEVDIENNAAWYGGIVGSEVSLSNNARVVFDNQSGHIQINCH